MRDWYPETILLINKKTEIKIDDERGFFGDRY